MKRLTVHVENAPFITKEQKVVSVSKEKGQIKKPKKPKCIVNTLSVRHLKSSEVDLALVQLRSKYTIAKRKDGSEMVFISNEKLF
jgi:hypothetical protein